jgi:outer membrane protein assembly factor BamB
MPRVWWSLTVLLGILPGSVGALEPSTDWPQWRGPLRDNKSTFQGLNKDWAAQPPKLLWSIKGLGKGYASVAIQGARLYTTGNMGDGQAVVAVNLDDHQIAWTKLLTSSDPKHSRDGSRGTPTVDGDRLYVVTSNGTIACLNAADGHLVWQRDYAEWDGRMMSGWGFSESPLVDGDRLVITPGSSRAMMVCLNKADGSEVWKSEVPDQGEAGKRGAGYSSVVVSEAAGVKQYVQLIGRGVIGVRADDGKLLWSYNRVANGTANVPTPIIAGDYVFTASGYKDGGSALLKLSKTDDGVKADELYYYNNSELQNHHGGMVLVGDQIYMGHGHGQGFPVCVDLLSGKIHWNAREQSRNIGNGSAAITYVDGHIIHRYESGPVALYETNPAEFKFKGALQPAEVNGTAWAQPVVVAGKLYLRDQGTLMVYDVSAK